jgi:hypothetical protein
MKTAAYMEFLAILSVQTKFVTGSESHTARLIWCLFQLFFNLVELRVSP